MSTTTRRNQPQREDAFTLIEIMAVLIILGILAGYVGVKVFGVLETGKRKAAASQIAGFGSALDTYRMDCNHYPTTEQGLKVLLNDSSAGGSCRNYMQGGYIKNIPLDPWGYEYVYFCPGLNNEEYSIESYGADGQDGGDGPNADVESWNLSGAQ